MDIKHITGHYDLNTGLYHSMSLPDLAYTDQNGNVVEVAGEAFGPIETDLSLYAESLSSVSTVLFFDRAERTLTISQDIMGGDRHVYYAEHNDKVYISTSLRKLLDISGLEAHLDIDEARVFMHHGFCPDSNTLISGIKKVRPHTRLKITTSGIEEDRMQRSTDFVQTVDSEELFYSTELKVIDEYVGRWHSRRVPVMALSAGFDSNLILDRALRRGFSPHIITIGDKTARSEHNAVEQICSIKGIKNKNFATVSHYTFDNYCDIVNRLEGSVFEPGIFLQYELAREAQKCRATDMICGECADQVFNENFCKGNFNSGGCSRNKELSKEDLCKIDFKFGSSPYELAEGIIIKKSGIMLASFGIRGIYPYCDHEMISAADRVAVLNGKNKTLHVNNCRKSMAVNHFGMLNKVGGSTSLTALFRSADEEKEFKKQVRRRRLINELGAQYTRRYGPEYDYDLIDCLCAYYIELFRHLFCIC